MVDHVNLGLKSFVASIWNYMLQQESSRDASSGFIDTFKSLFIHISNIDSQQDVTQKIMYFLQQSMREMCILSASGSISSASLSQPATSGGNIAYEVVVYECF